MAEQDRTPEMQAALKHWGSRTYALLSGSNCAVNNLEDETMSTANELSVANDPWALPPIVQRRGRGQCAGQPVETRPNHASNMKDNQRSNSFVFSATLGSAHKIAFAKPSDVLIDEAARVDILTTSVLGAFERMRTLWLVGGQHILMSPLDASDEAG